MFRRALLLVTALCAIATPAHAQFVVIDPANLVQTTLIADRVQQHYTELRAQYLTVLRMAQRLGSLDRLPDSADCPDLARSVAGGTSDDRGFRRSTAAMRPAAAYLSTALPLLRPTTTPADADAQRPDRCCERQYATVEITDSVAMMGGHQVALARGYHGQLQSAVESLQNDVLNGLLALSRDDGDPRQDRGRRAARASAGHGSRTSSCRTPSSSCSHAASGCATRRPPRSTCSSSPGAMGAPRTRRSSPAPATRFGRGVSRSHRSRRLEDIMRRLLLGLIAVALAAQPARAQLSVYDPANTARNTITAIYQAVPARNGAGAAREAMRRWPGASAPLPTCAATPFSDVPRWRTHGGDFLLRERHQRRAHLWGPARGGVPRREPSGAERTGCARTADASGSAAYWPAGWRHWNMADAVAMSAINDTGSLRLNGRKQELPAIDALEAHVIDPSLEQSATAVLDKISGAVLHRCATAAGAQPAPDRRSWSSCWSTRSGRVTPTRPR